MADANFHFFYGDDAFVVDNAARAFFTKLSNGTDEYSREIMDAASKNEDEAVEIFSRFCSAVQTVSMFGDKKFVWLRGLSWLNDSPHARSETTVELAGKLLDLLKNNKTAEVEIVVSAVKPDGRRTETKAFVKAAGAEKLEFSPMQIARDECGKWNVQIEPDALEALVGQVNGTPGVLVQEIQKLACYLGAGGGVITSKMIMELVPPFGVSEGGIFAPVEEFFTGNLARALEATRVFFFQQKKGTSRALITNFQNRFRLLIQLRVLLDAGAISPGERGIGKFSTAAAEYGNFFGDGKEKTTLNVFSQNPFYLTRLAPALRHFSLRDLTEMQLDMTAVFEEILKRPHDEEVIFREFCVRHLGKK